MAKTIAHRNSKELHMLVGEKNHPFLIEIQKQFVYQIHAGDSFTVGNNTNADVDLSRVISSGSKSPFLKLKSHSFSIRVSFLIGDEGRPLFRFFTQDGMEMSTNGKNFAPKTHETVGANSKIFLQFKGVRMRIDTPRRNIFNVVRELSASQVSNLKFIIDEMELNHHRRTAELQNLLPLYVGKVVDGRGVEHLMNPLGAELWNMDQLRDYLKSWQSEPEEAQAR